MIKYVYITDTTQGDMVLVSTDSLSEVERFLKFEGINYEPRSLATLSYSLLKQFLESVCQSKGWECSIEFPELKPYLMQVEFSVYVPDCENELNYDVNWTRLVYAADPNHAAALLRQAVMSSSHNCGSSVFTQSIEVENLTLEVA